MKSISRLLLILLVVIVPAVPGESAAQTVCEGFSTVLKAMSRARDKLEFYTLPGATCEYDYPHYVCDWPMPKRDSRTFTRRSEFDEWDRNASNKLKKLAGAFHQCIDEKKVPYEWDSFESESEDGWKTKYYVYTESSLRPKISVVLCTFSHSLTEGWLRLRVSMSRHEDTC